MVQVSYARNDQENFRSGPSQNTPLYRVAVRIQFND